MLFHHLKYISPAWYFNLKPALNHGYFPTSDELAKAGVDLQPDKQYRSEEARERDLAYRAFQHGYIRRQPADTTPGAMWETPSLPPADEYRFLRKNFSAVWVWYVLILRLLSLKNPRAELSGFAASNKAQRDYYHLRPITYPDWEHYQSTLVEEAPLITVVIPTLNRYDYLKDVFRDLEQQTYSHFEVIVVDQTDPFDESVYHGWQLDLRYWYQSEKALWKARNDAIEAARGSYILLYDDDSRVEPDWIAAHLKALDFFDADLSSGVSISTVGARVPEHYRYFRWSDQLDTGNVLLKRAVFEKIGLFDRQFEKQRMGDGEYGLRAYLAGFKNVSNPRAQRLHLKVGQGGLRQMGSWDGWRPKKFLGPRPVPSILYLYRKYHGAPAARRILLKGIPPSIIPYQFKGSKPLMVVGSFLSLLLAPLVLWQVLNSWRQAGKMLNEGAKVKKLAAH